MCKVDKFREGLVIIRVEVALEKGDRDEALRRLQKGTGLKGTALRLRLKEIEEGLRKELTKPVKGTFYTDDEGSNGDPFEGMRRKED